VLVVGGGPAGLEAARALGQRGHEVCLAEARRELGGRVTRESRLPGLAEWARVRDWRIGQINKLPDVSVYLDSTLTAQDVLDFGAHHVVLATGCHWRRDGFGRSHGLGIPGFADHPQVYTLDDLMDGRIPAGRVAVLDDDGFYYASIAAELLHAHGCDVVYVTPEDSVAPWSLNTLDYRHIRKRLAKLGIEVIVSHTVAAYDGDILTLDHAWEDRQQPLPVDAVLTVTARLPDDALYRQLLEREADWADAGIQTVRNIGDSDAPGLIAHAVYAGHRYARGLGEPVTGEVAFKRHFHGIRAYATNNQT
jgi:dimethylamine/trimethylamine dehydrogenase